MTSWLVLARWREALARRRWAYVAMAAAGGYMAYMRLAGRRRKKKARPGLALRAAMESEVVGGPPPSGVAWTSSVEGDLVRGRSSEGPASWASETVPFLVERLAGNETAALAWEEGEEASGRVKFASWSWREYVGEVRRAASAMVSLGLEPRQACAILGFNSKEWLVSDLGAIVAGGFATGIYATNGVESVRYIVEHSRAAIVVVEGAKQAAKVQAALERDPLGVKALVSYGPDREPFGRTAGLLVRTLMWAEFVALEGPDVALKASRQRPGQTCTLIYTSGTTGAPKAVAVSHDNITWVVRTFACMVGFGHAGHERLVSYLPLSHIAAQAIDIYANLCTVGRRIGDDDFGCRVEAATLYFARPDALKGSLKVTLCAVRPTTFFGVPRVFEKFAEALQAVGAKTTGLKKSVSSWAKAVMLASYRRRRADYQPEAFEGLFQVAARALRETLAMALLRKVHAAIGLDACHFVFTGAAPIAVATLEYFGSLGLTVNEAFGMSEVAGPASVTLDDYFVPGTCGPVCPGVEVRLDHVPGRDKPEEGEVCFRGRSVMLGYLRNEEKSRETIDADGWLHSGDAGALVAVGRGTAPMLKITGAAARDATRSRDDARCFAGRIKELLITAGGENVPPVPIEDALKDLLPVVSNAVVVGDKLKFLSVLLTLKQQPNELTGSFDDLLVGPAALVDPSVATAAQAAKSDVFASLVQAAIDKYNDTLAVSAAQKIHKWALLPTDFSQATGELTPTLKLKRAAVVDKYSHVILGLYGSAASAVWAA